MKHKRKKTKRKSNVRNIAIIAVTVVVVGAIIAYNYSAEQTRQKGLVFGMELEAIQDKVKTLQTEFYSERTKWEEGDTSREDLLGFYDMHVKKFEDVIEEYNALEPPGLFDGTVKLLRLSSQTQLDSDSEYIKWIKDGDQSSKARSDALLQDALEYELLGLVEFYSAKTNIKSYDDRGEEFEAPQMDIIQKVGQVTEHMIAECEREFGASAIPDDSNGRVTSGPLNLEWANCIAEAEEWRQAHLP